MAYVDVLPVRPPNAVAPASIDGSYGRLYDRLAIICLVGVFIAAVLTFGDFAISTDEQVQHTYGRLLLDYYLSGLTDTRVFEYSNLYLYGGLFDLIAAIVSVFSPLPDYETRHLICAIIGLCGIFAAWRLGRLAGGPRVGLLTVVLLTVCPAYYGAMFNNTKDVPFAAGMTWLLYLSCRLLPELPRPSLRIVVGLGTAAGLSLGIRVGALLGGFYLIPVLALHCLDSARRVGRRQAMIGAGVMLVRLLPAVVVALALMAVLWPWSVMAPGNIFTAVHDLTQFDIPTVLAGHLYSSHDIPPWYIPAYFLVKLPESVLVGLLASVIASVVCISRTDHFLSTIRYRQWLIITLAATLPVLYAVVTEPALYNGLRHFLFVVTPMCVLAAAGLDRMFTLIRRWRTVFGLALTLFASAVVKDVWTMVALHPHEYVYYNLLVGGVSGANGRYETDYWSNFTREAIDRLTDRLAAENGGSLPDRTYDVDLCTSSWPLTAYAPPQLRTADDCQDADFFISTTNTNCDRICNGRTIIEIKRLGVVLGVVKDRRSIAGMAERGAQH
ncbi:MAG: glycosyltransferase family 39 protein [Rhodospirillales bacterium]|nr:glycosyltransferase family 39 protein [Rhodospirillales bacterium]